jgi:hypothetical protein
MYRSLATAGPRDISCACAVTLVPADRHHGVAPFPMDCRCRRRAADASGAEVTTHNKKIVTSRGLKTEPRLDELPSDSCTEIFQKVGG